MFDRPDDLLSTAVSTGLLVLCSKQKVFMKYCLTQWISKLPGSFETHGVRQDLVNFMGVVGIVNATVYKKEPIFTDLGHGRLS